MKMITSRKRYVSAVVKGPPRPNLGQFTHSSSLLFASAVGQHTRLRTHNDWTRRLSALRDEVIHSIGAKTRPRSPIIVLEKPFSNVIFLHASYFIVDCPDESNLDPLETRSAALRLPPPPRRPPPRPPVCNCQS